MKKTDFDDKLKKLNKNVTLCRAKHAETEKKITDLTNKVAEILKKGCDFLLGRMYFTGNDGYQNFSFFASLLTSLMLDSNKTLSN